MPFFDTNMKRKNPEKIDDFLKDLLKEKKRKLVSQIPEEFLRNCNIKREVLWVH